MDSLQYTLKQDGVEVQHTDWSKLFIHEDIILKNFINKEKNWVFQSSKKLSLKGDLAQSFFNWMNEKFPEINRFSIIERDELLKTYRFDTWDFSLLDPKSFTKSLPFNVKSKKVSLRWATHHWYTIENWLKKKYFPEEYKSI